MSGLFRFFPGAGETGPDDLLHAARVLLWVRLFFLAAGLVEIHYRIEYGSLSHVLNTFYCVGILSATGGVLWKVRRTGVVRPAWLFGLSVLDLLVISFSVSLSGGFHSPYFPTYYFAVAVFSYAFPAPRLVLAWTTLVAVVYSVLSFMVDPVLDLSAKEEQHLFYRLVPLYAVAVAVGIISGMERERRRRGLERERELQRQRIELSQNIHDHTAQWAYVVSVGVDEVLEMAQDLPGDVVRRLRLVAELSRSAMWELRHPIDGGQIFRGEDLGRVLSSHVSTFSVITSLPAELVRTGTEPALSVIGRALLFSIAHNALTNVIRHASATRVVVHLDCDGEELWLSVSDNGVGLPGDYQCRGHGFRNMRSDAERMGGVLVVESGPESVGTMVACVVPCRNLSAGD